MSEKKVLAALITLVSVLASTFVALHVPNQVEAGKEIVREVESQVKDERWQSVFRLTDFAFWLIGVALLLSALMPLVIALSAFLRAALEVFEKSEAHGGGGLR